MKTLLIILALFVAFVVIALLFIYLIARNLLNQIDEFEADIDNERMCGEMYEREGRND